jgi:hypothetical protein
MSKDESAGRVTIRGFGELSRAERIHDDLPMQSPAVPAPRPFPEFERLEVKGGADLVDGEWTAYAIHTQRRVYCLDAHLDCRAVLDLASLVPVKAHPVIGAELVGAQHKDAEGRVTHVVRPLPESGAHAVFSKRVGGRVQVSETSPVTRLVLRVQSVAFSK